MIMKAIYKITENIFEKFSSVALKVFGSSITFILAVIVVVVYLASSPFSRQSFHNSIYDIILCFTFLGFFIIQKTFNKYNTALNLKINELVSAHDKASNRLVNIEKKTESELQELAKHYHEIAEESEKTGALNTAKTIEHILDRQKDGGGTKKEK
jgi:low affinity Fe/Cu permease